MCEHCPSLWQTVKELIAAWRRPKVEAPRRSSPDRLTLAMNHNHVCPDCGGSLFVPGPEGGGSMNVKCATCGSKFNYTGFCPPERIDNDDSLYVRRPRPLVAL